MVNAVIFFFSSRRRHTSSLCDWSSDVCSSDLTATPLQNDLRELYNLITLLRPGQLGTWQEFKAEHLVSGDHRQPRDPEALRALTHEVMIRTRRSSVALDLDLPPRRDRKSVV